MMRYNYHTRGFTVMETLIVVAVSVVLIFAFINLYIGYDTLFSAEEVRLTARESASVVVSTLYDAALQADTILASRTVAGSLYTTGADTLVLELPAITSSGDVIAETFDYVAFYVSGTGVYRVLEANAASSRVSGITQLTAVLDPSPSAFVLGYDTADVTEATRIDISVTTTAQSGHQNSQSHLEQSVYIRNK